MSGMKYSTFSRKDNDQLQEPMFFGQAVNVARYDQQKYKVFEDLTEKQLSFFWRPEEVDVSKDRLDYQSLNDAEKHIFTSNLKYQILLDSVQGRSPSTVLIPIVSIPELETWIETWSFSECLADGTEVLTLNGWKDLSVCTTNDKCLVYNLDNDNVHFEHPKRIPEYDVDDYLVEYKAKNSKQFHQLVTPNHRMPIINKLKSDKKGKRYFKQAGKQDYKPHHQAPISGYLKSNSCASAMTPFERLLVAIQADGSISKRYNGVRCGTVPINISLKKQRKINRLIDIVNECDGVKLVEMTDCKRGLKRFKLNVDLTELVNVGLVYSGIKDFTWIDFDNIDSNWCDEFLYELSMWDGTRNKSGYTDSFSYSTVNEYNAGIVQGVATLCGRSPRMVKSVDDRKDSYQDVYTINFIDSNVKDGESIEKYLTHYKGKVRCLETSTGAFVIRYNGVVSVTGNTIHSRSYTHIIRNIVNDPNIIFGDIMKNEHILKRAEDVSKYYDDLLLHSQLHNLYGYGVVEYNGVEYNITHRDLIKKLFLCIMSVNVLEAIRFYVSFACSFAFAERKLMEGNAKIIKLIARDESLHMVSTQNIINIMKNSKGNDGIGDIYDECVDECVEIFKHAVVQEKEWAEYLFKDGSMVGLNKEILNQYIEYIANIRMKAVGLEPLFDVTSNPIPWINSWLSSDNVQVAPQETEISSYLVGQIDSDVDGDAFGGFEL